MKNIFNFRFFVVAFLSLMAGIFAIVKLFETNNIYFIILSVFIILLLTYLVISVIINKPYFKATKIKTICIITVLLFSIIGGGLTYLKLNNFNPVNFEHEVFVEGKISQKNTSSNNNKYLILKDVKVDNKNIDYNILVYYDGDFSLEEGYIISFKSKLISNKIKTLEGLNTFVCLNNNGYTTFVYSINTVNTNISFLEKFKINVKNKLFSNMSEDNAGLSQAVLFGDKQNLNGNIKQSFGQSGVSHLLAISGLHVGIFISVVYFILNKCKIKKYISFIVAFVILLLFNILCNFTPSVVRASIMSLALLLAACFGKRSDAISNLSLAGILLLIINPISLYDIGFELSFLAVFGILLLNKPLQKLFVKIKCPKTLAGYLCSTISATLFTLPVVANTFGFLAVGLLIANIILIPLFTVFYISLLITTIFSFIPSFDFLLNVPNFLCDSMVSLSNLIAKLGTFNVFNFGIIALVTYLILGVITSKYAMIKPLNKTICFCLITVVLCSVLLLDKHENIVYKDDIFVYNTVSNCSLVAGSNSNNYLMNIGNGSYSDLNNISDLLNKLKIQKIKAVVVSDYDPNMQYFIGDFLLEYNVETLYIPEFIESYNLHGLNKNLKSNVKVILTNFNEINYLENDIYFYGIYSQANSCKFLMYNNKNKVVAQNCGRLSVNQITSLKEKVKEDKIDILIQSTINQNYENSIWLGKDLIITNKYYLKNFEKVVINNSYYVKINAIKDVMYEIY